MWSISNCHLWQFEQVPSQESDLPHLLHNGANSHGRERRHETHMKSPSLPHPRQLAGYKNPTKLFQTRSKRSLPRMAGIHQTPLDHSPCGGSITDTMKSPIYPLKRVFVNPLYSATSTAWVSFSDLGCQTLLY